ncbi:hypothetical protein NQ314_002175 [Rhamnusium bicolor]|uniref:DDE Tnp4 domain-containing protein n=1 Tax=Rhamnusium bicolor TaxID=1586634 RepID=A0AAV8ZQ27_9CUCU|nr:hypothetical protein NQ314_002175 [Rhamnusium bicolor]
MRLDFVLIANEAFALHKHLLKLYANRELTHEKRIFNYRLSRARNVSEDAFGLLTSSFRIFHTAMSLMDVESINYIVAAACTLHNFLLSHSPRYLTTSNFDRINKKSFENDEGEWRNENAVVLTPLQTRNLKNATAEAKLQRYSYCDFFNGVGKVECQESR